MVLEGFSDLNVGIKKVFSTSKSLFLTWIVMVLLPLISGLFSLATNSEGQPSPAWVHLTA